MEQLTRAQILANLVQKPIPDADYDRIADKFPLTDRCPTCSDIGKYTLDFEVRKCDCKMQKLLQRHYFYANIGREYHDIGLEHYEGDDSSVVIPAVAQYVSDFDNNYHYGLGLTFTGPYGTGKTFAMTCVLKELVKRGKNTYFITFEDMIDAWADYRDSASKELLQSKLKKVDVLGLDELRTDQRNAGGFLANGLDHVIRFRTANLLPTLITTNMNETSEEHEFTKAFSLLSAKNTRIETKGHDRRKQEVLRRNHELAMRGERRPIC